MNSEINIWCFCWPCSPWQVFNKLFFTKDKWTYVKLYSYLMVMVCTFKFVS
jgi:hypothetical protein